MKNILPLSSRGLRISQALPGNARINMLEYDSTATPSLADRRDYALKTGSNVPFSDLVSGGAVGRFTTLT